MLNINKNVEHALPFRSPSIKICGSITHFIKMVPLRIYSLAVITLKNDYLQLLVRPIWLSSEKVALACE